MWMRVTLAMLQCLTPLHTLKPSALYVFCKAPPQASSFFFFNLNPLSVIHCHTVAPASPGSPICTDLRDACVRYGTAFKHIRARISKLPSHSFPTTLIEKNMKENQKQTCMIRCFLSKRSVRSHLLFLSLALTCLNSDHVQVCSLFTAKVMAKV